MPEDRLCKDGWLNAYVMYTSSQASPSLFHLWTAISTISGVLRRNVWMDRGYYTLYPNLYVVLVSPTGRCMKSTASDIGVTEFLYKMEGVRILHEKITPEGLISYLGDAPMASVGSSNGQKETKFRQECTAFIYAPELSVFLGTQSYSQGLVELLTSLYGGKNEWEYTTKTKGVTKLTNVCLNMLGASNPVWLAKGFGDDTFGGGFMGRTIFLFQDEGKKVAWPHKTDAQKMIGSMLHLDLHKIAKLRGKYEVDSEAVDFFEEFYNSFEGDFSGRLAGYYERKPDHLLKLSMIIAASNSDEMIVRKKHMETAKNMLENAEETMRGAFAYIGATNEAVVAQHILEFMKDKAGFATKQDILKEVRQMLRNSREFTDILSMLEDSEMIHGWMKGQTKTYYLHDEFVAAIEKLKEK